ncbi:MAG: glutamate 5-kinase [Planctomycetota bacterium]
MNDLSGSTSRRIVVKVGSSVIAPGLAVSEDRLASIARQISMLIEAGHRVTLVTSGAIAAGLAGLSLDAMPEAIIERQTAAAVGQTKLMNAWAHAFTSRTIAQVLLTEDDLDHRERFLNARRTIESLQHHGVVPILNENDSVSFEEIRLGDNDRLSAIAAASLGADLLIVLSVAPGLLDEEGRLIGEVRQTEDVREHVRDDTSASGTGGMHTKLDAASIALAHSFEMVIASGEEPDVVTRVVSGEAVGTRFIPDRRQPLAARKSWIGLAAKTRGRLVVDEGARAALVDQGASLLPKGIAQVKGEFVRGSVVEIASQDGEVFARGIVSYATADVLAIKGQQTSGIAVSLGYHYADEVVHRDDLLILTPQLARTLRR